MPSNDHVEPADSAGMPRLGGDPRPFHAILLGAVLAWLGLLDCLLLLESHGAARSFICQGGGCDAVLGSAFASIGGVPLAALGIAYYALILGMLLTVHASFSRVWRERLLDGALWVLLLGLSLSLGLMYLQFAVLRAFCPLCTASAVITGALTLTVAWAIRTHRRMIPASSRSGALTMAVFAVLPTVVFLAMGHEKASRPLRLDLSTAQLAGNRQAPVQLVVFSDYQCGFCRQLVPVLQQIRLKFPDDVLIAHRDYPLKGHPRAVPAAVAAYCAGQQGAFWEYHDRLYVEGKDLGDPRLLEIAQQLRLDLPRFSECLKSDSAQQAVQESREDAEVLGLEGVPVVFLNGRRVDGALNLSNLEARIQALLSEVPKPPGQ
jgi:protein-disulfide isomerase